MQVCEAKKENGEDYFLDYQKAGIFDCLFDYLTGLYQRHLSIFRNDLDYFLEQREALLKYKEHQIWKQNNPLNELSPLPTEKSPSIEDIDAEIKQMDEKIQTIMEICHVSEKKKIYKNDTGKYEVLKIISDIIASNDLSIKNPEKHVSRIWEIVLESLDAKSGSRLTKQTRESVRDTLRKTQAKPGALADHLHFIYFVMADVIIPEYINKLILEKSSS